MTVFQTRKLGQEILDILGAERIILLAGRLEKLAEVSQRKENLISQMKLRPGVLDSAIANEIRGAAQANALLYASAKSGLKAVLSRFDDFSSHGRSFQTYSPNGKKIKTSTAQHERKA